MLLFIIYLLFFEVASIFTYIISFIQLFYDHINIPHIWGKICIGFCGCKVFLINKSHSLYLSNTKRCIYLCNHRDIYDFPIDAYLTSGTGIFISRYIVMFAFPIQYIYTCIIKNTYYFKRTTITNKAQFNKDIYNALLPSYYKNLIIYPEGTRRLENTPIQIKKGAMHIAWEYKMVMQVIITRNKELILNLKKLTAKQNVDLYCYRSEVINPEYFSTFDEFNNYVSIVWKDSWEKVYNPEETQLIYEPLNSEPYKIKYSRLFFTCHNIIPILLFILYMHKNII